MKKIFLVSTVLLGSLGLVSPVAAASNIDHTPPDFSALLCVDAPDSGSVYFWQPQSTEIGALQLQTVTGSPNDFTLTMGLPNGGQFTSGGGTNGFNLWLFYFNYSCEQFEQFGSIYERLIPIDQPDIPLECFTITVDKANFNETLATSTYNTWEGDPVWNNMKLLGLEVTFGTTPTIVGPATFTIQVDTSTCWDTTGTDSAPSGPKFDFQLPTVDHDLPATGSGSIVFLSTLGTFLLLAGTILTSRSRRFTSN